VVQIFTAEEREMKKFKSINKDHRNANIKGIWYYSIFFLAVEIISDGAGVAGVVWRL
jgi:ATP-binding cassette subfamily B protein